VAWSESPDGTKRERNKANAVCGYKSCAVANANTERHAIAAILRDEIAALCEPCRHAFTACALDEILNAATRFEEPLRCVGRGVFPAPLLRDVAPSLDQHPIGRKQAAIGLSPRKGNLAPLVDERGQKLRPIFNAVH
jgi:hypothetical protein